jgi:nuclease S1
VKKNAAILALLSFLPAQLFSWGPKGHAVIADIAASRLTPTTRANLDLLLGNNSLASISTWPDAIRSDRDETYGWHFVDIPANATGFDEARDCFRPQDSDKHPSAATDHHNCVVDRIEMFGQVLADRNATERDRLLALLFLVHFVADVHQPMHAIDEARGANDIKVTVFGVEQCGNNPCNLHGVWDSGLVEHTGYTEEQYVSHLNELIARNHLEQKAGGSPADWANESHREAIRALVKNGAAIDEAYYRANIQLVDERLALAGVRLAALLNDRLGKIPTDQFKQDLLRHQH